MLDLEGGTVAEVVGAFGNVAPPADQVKVRTEIERFLAGHGDNRNAAFDTTFRPDVIPAALLGSTRAFLEEIRDLLG
jgi:hypothetical protein